MSQNSCSFQTGSRASNAKRRGRLLSPDSSGAGSEVVDFAAGDVWSWATSLGVPAGQSTGVGPFLISCTLRAYGQTHAL